MEGSQRAPKHLLLRIHSWLVEWAEKNGFDWIDVATFHSPSQMITMTIKHAKYPGLQRRIIISQPELVENSEELIFSTMLPLKTNNLTEELALRIRRLEEENKLQELNRSRA